MVALEQGNDGAVVVVAALVEDVAHDGVELPAAKGHDAIVGLPGKAVREWPRSSAGSGLAG
jgi:hypothetical protein